jgi:RNA recognition motif-containing protein
MAVDRPKVNQFRNKGYCFIHFSDANMAQKFITEISDYNVSERPSVDDSANNAQNEQEEPKKMYAVFAKYQGLSTNLHNLLDIESKKWRPKNGFACVRTSSGLSNISLLGLRILAKRHATSVTTHGNRPLPGNVSEDDDDDDVDDHNDLSNEKVTRA